MFSQLGEINGKTKICILYQINQIRWIPRETQHTHYNFSIYPSDASTERIKRFQMRNKFGSNDLGIQFTVCARLLNNHDCPCLEHTLQKVARNA